MESFDEDNASVIVKLASNETNVRISQYSVVALSNDDYQRILLEQGRALLAYLRFIYLPSRSIHNQCFSNEIVCLSGEVHFAISCVLHLSTLWVKYYCK